MMSVVVLGGWDKAGGKAEQGIIQLQRRCSKTRLEQRERGVPRQLQ